MPSTSEFSTPAAPPFGLYVPLITFFNADESLDLHSTEKHALRMIQGGAAGLVLQGSNGEAPHLMHTERKVLIRHIRKTLDDAGSSQAVIIAGCAASSVFETLIHIREAEESGANFALLLPPSYWTAAMNPSVVERYFSEVAAASLLPFLIYNFPAVTSGLDVSSDTINSLAQEHPGKVVGAKLTCGNLGKLQRIAHQPGPFAVFAGKSDFCLPGLVAGSNGVIAALANVVPKVHVHLLVLYKTGKMAEAQTLQTDLSNADWALSKTGVAGVKAVVSTYFGYGSGGGRRPLGVYDVQSLAVKDRAALEKLVSMEKTL